MSRELLLRTSFANALAAQETEILSSVDAEYATIDDLTNYATLNDLDAYAGIDTETNIINSTHYGSQAANRILAGPTTGADDLPTWRAIVAADLPTFTANRLLRTNGSGVLGTTDNLTWDEINSRLGLLTTLPTHSLTIGSTGSGIVIYNTVDQITNFERLRFQWGSNVAVIGTAAGGTGTVRPLQIAGGGRVMTLGGSNLLTGFFNLTASTGTGTAHSVVGVNGTFSNSAAVISNALAFIPTYNQSGSAGYRVFWVSPYIQATGSGVKILVDIGTNSAADGAGTHTSKFKIEGDGHIVLEATNTAAGTTGNQTINKTSGIVNIAAGGTSITVTNSLVTANSIIEVGLRTNDATAWVKNYVPAVGSFTINLGAAATGEVSIGFVVKN